MRHLQTAPRDCGRCSLRGYCYSDPITWEFRSQQEAAEVLAAMERCQQDTLTAGRGKAKRKEQRT